MMNFWTPTFDSWGGGLNDYSMPWYARYDYLEVHRYNWDTGDFYFHWRDDFDTFDESRWEVKEGWTFESNSSTFYRSQVYSENGALVLKMEKNWGNELRGYSNYLQ